MGDAGRLFFLFFICRIGALLPCVPPSPSCILQPLFTYPPPPRLSFLLGVTHPGCALRGASSSFFPIYLAMNSPAASRTRWYNVPATLVLPVCHSIVYNFNYKSTMGSLPWSLRRIKQMTRSSLSIQSRPFWPRVYSTGHLCRSGSIRP